MAARVFWAVVFGFLAGVFARSFVSFGFAPLLFFVALSVAVFLTAGRRAATAVPFFIFVIAFCGGALRIEGASLSGDTNLSRALGTKITITGVVSSEPDVRDTGERMVVDVKSIVTKAGETPAYARVLVLAPLHGGISYGDVISASGALRAPEVFDTGAGRQFNYVGYLASHGIQYELAFATVNKTGARDGNIIQSFVIAIKQKYLESLAYVLPEPEAGLAGGITAGDKRGLGSELSDAFKRVSLVHAVVLSGYNITVVIDALNRVFAGGWLLHMRLGAGAVIAIFFALISGGASASVRAAIMALIAILGHATNRTYLAGRALGATLVVMVLWNPFSLAFDPGFQLSALATAGLIWISPIAARFAARVPRILGLREVIVSTISAQIAVLPLLLYQNGLISLVALPVNALALIAVPSAMAFSAIAAIGGFIFGTSATLLAFPAFALLWYIIHVAQFFAALPFSAVSVPAFSFVWIVAAYLTLVIFVVYKKTRSPLSRAPTHLETKTQLTD